MGKVLSQGEIDNLLTSLLEDASVLPGLSDAGGETTTEAVGIEPIPAGIAAFKAKIAAMQPTSEPSQE
ncbi:MAG: hypothetical protein FWF94_05680 [Oscillospiraceae bacterium]|nr:hypothetical protein [Oscillospiraceae bacterium]